MDWVRAPCNTIIWTQCPVTQSIHGALTCQPTGQARRKRAFSWMCTAVCPGTQCVMCAGRASWAPWGSATPVRVGVIAAPGAGGSTIQGGVGEHRQGLLASTSRSRGSPSGASSGVLAGFWGAFARPRGAFPCMYQNLLYQNLLAFVALGRVEARRTFYIVVSSHRIERLEPLDWARPSPTTQDRAGAGEVYFDHSLMALGLLPRTVAEAEGCRTERDGRCALCFGVVIFSYILV